MIHFLIISVWRRAVSMLLSLLLYIAKLLRVIPKGSRCGSAFTDISPMLYPTFLFLFLFFKDNLDSPGQKYMHTQHVDMTFLFTSFWIPNGYGDN